MNPGISFNGSRQTVQIYNGGAITLTDLYFVSQSGNGVCRVYDVNITTTGVGATKLTFTAAVGNNSVYLPLDGSVAIGKDQSPCGNNWTPVNFAGFPALNRATGALPILDTVSGGQIASVGLGVRTDTSGSSCVLALPLTRTAQDVSNKINCLVALYPSCFIPLYINVNKCIMIGNRNISGFISLKISYKIHVCCLNMVIMFIFD